MSTVITVEVCEAQIRKWNDCISALSEGKTFQIGDRILSYENADIAKTMLNDWINRKNQLLKSQSNSKRFRGFSGQARFS